MKNAAARLLGLLHRLFMGFGRLGLWLVSGVVILFLVFLTANLIIGFLAYFGTIVVGVVALILQSIGLPREIVEPLWTITRFLREWASDPPCDPRGRC